MKYNCGGQSRFQKAFRTASPARNSRRLECRVADANTALQPTYLNDERN
jgi:hypothetical protein